MLLSTSAILTFFAAIQISFQRVEMNDTTIRETKNDVRELFGTESPSNATIERPGNNSYGTSCSVPCVSVFKCEELFKIYKNALSATSEDRQTLRNHFCGWSQGVLNVCCCSNTDAQKHSSDKCGRKPGIAIRGGAPALPGAWPSMTALFSRVGDNGIPKFRCGGSLISHEWVLTAAHCIPASHSRERLVHVVLSACKLNETVADGADSVKVNLLEVIKHPQYKKKPVLNDIALLRLSKPVEYNKYIQPVYLHSGEQYLNDSSFYKNKKASIVGWGYPNSASGHVSSSLLEAQIPVVDTIECKKDYAQYSASVQIDETLICAGKGGKDTCYGDSGGPLMFKNFKTNIWSQGGITSFGKTCGERGFPGVYTRVAAFVDWIRETTKLEL